MVNVNQKLLNAFLIYELEKRKERTEDMFYITGDTHGTIDISKVIEFFNQECDRRVVGLDDYLIILGDVGLYWDNGASDAAVRRILEKLPCTTLWIDGNHENFDLLSLLKVKKWNGGYVQKCGKHIYHLMRGQVYEIDNKRFFTFGGGISFDRNRRVPHFSYWEQEMPSSDEYDAGIENLENVDYKVDYVLTHTCPLDIANKLTRCGDKGEIPLNRYLGLIAKELDFDHWYFGHWHKDRDFDKFSAVYNRVITI